MKGKTPLEIWQMQCISFSVQNDSIKSQYSRSKQREKILSSFIHLEKNERNTGSLRRKPIEREEPFKMFFALDQCRFNHYNQ